MKTLLQIRKKTGFSQYELADYLGISRSLVNMAEKGLRDLPNEAFLKLLDMEKVIARVQVNEKSIPANAEDKASKKIKDLHKRKVEDHLFKARTLQRRLAIMLLSHQKEETKLKLVKGLTKNIPQAGKKKPDDRWLEYHDDISSGKILKKAASLHKLTLDIEVQLGYAAVHEKILDKL